MRGAVSDVEKGEDGFTHCMRSATARGCGERGRGRRFATTSSQDPAKEATKASSLEKEGQRYVHE